MHSNARQESAGAAKGMQDLEGKMDAYLSCCAIDWIHKQDRSSKTSCNAALHMCSKFRSRCPILNATVGTPAPLWYTPDELDAVDGRNTQLNSRKVSSARPCRYAGHVRREGRKDMSTALLNNLQDV